MILKQRHPQVYSSAFQADEELVHCKIPLAQIYLVDSSYFCRRGNGGPAPALAMPFGGNLDPMQQLQMQMQTQYMQMQQMQDQFLMRQGQQSQAPGGNRLKSLANLQTASRLPWWTRKASAELGAAGDTRRPADVPSDDGPAPEAEPAPLRLADVPAAEGPPPPEAVATRRPADVPAAEEDARQASAVPGAAAQPVRKSAHQVLLDYVSMETARKEESKEKKKREERTARRLAMARALASGAAPREPRTPATKLKGRRPTATPQKSAKGTAPSAPQTVLPEQVV